MTISLQQLPFDPARMWDEPMIEMTQSALSTFLACPQKYVLRYLMFLQKQGINPALITGSAVHKGLEVLIDPLSPIPRDQRIIPAGFAVDKVFDSALDKTDLLPIGGTDTLDVGRAQAHAILEAWDILYTQDLEKWTIVEKEMRVRIDPSASIQSPLEDRMAGMIDGVMLDEEGIVWILEHKTRSSFRDFSITGLNLNMQCLWYMILCKHVLKKRGKGALHPRGFMYDGMMKPQHRLNAYGWKDLKERMKNAMLEDPAKYFVVQPVPMPDIVVDAALASFRRLIKQIDGLNPSTVYKNFNACGDYGGCPYNVLCQNGADVAKPLEIFQMDGIEQFEFLPRHTELADDVADPEDAVKWGG